MPDQCAGIQQRPNDSTCIAQCVDMLMSHQWFSYHTNDPACEPPSQNPSTLSMLPISHLSKMGHWHCCYDHDKSDLHLAAIGALALHSCIGLCYDWQLGSFRSWLWTNAWQSLLRLQVLRKIERDVGCCQLQHFTFLCLIVELYSMQIYFGNAFY